MMTATQNAVSHFYDDTNFSGYSTWRSRLSSVVRARYPDLKGEINKILSENGGYIKVSNVYDDSIEFRYSKKFDENKHSVEEIFNGVFAALLCQSDNSGYIQVLSDAMFRRSTFNPHQSVNRELCFVLV